MKKIDFVCHIGFDALYDIGASIEKITEEMHANEVVEAILYPMGDAWIHTFKDKNSQLMEIARSNKNFHYFCTVNPWFGAPALQELKYNFQELGAAGVAFNTDRQGLYIDSPMIFPFIETAWECSKPVYFYTGNPVYGLPLNLANLAEKYPEVTFILGNMGASDFWGDVHLCFENSKNIYLETSMSPNAPVVLPQFIESHGFEKVLFGTNYPFTDYQCECEKIASCNFNESVNQAIYFSNTKKILRG
jgi:predicted TIM-barrel fold metal-dependent hydrolase